MESEVELNGSKLSEVDICDGVVCSEDESGVFVHSAASLHDPFCGFQRWTCPDEPPPRPDTSPGRQDDSGSPPGVPGSPGPPGRRAGAPRSSIVDCLLVELYETYGGGSRRNVDSWDSSTEASGSDAFHGRSTSGSGFLQELQEKHTRRHQMNYLAQKGEGLLHTLPRLGHVCQLHSRWGIRLE